MIILASDHAGYELKDYLKHYFTKHKIDFFDAGAITYDANDDYPDIANRAVKLVLEHKCKGIFICGSGVGMSMVANRHKGIRAVLAQDSQTAEMARMHNDANVLCLGARNITTRKATQIISTFLSTDFMGGKHQRRINKF
ncbi:MAG: RpiB/LacA/LacB family sugar-phosphate isomerase [Clostridia bacterium]|nr:RpiB/LacA/LacB family sugar-phosphate isomerase [Clostridia bacterium]